MRFSFSVEGLDLRCQCHRALEIDEDTGVVECSCGVVGRVDLDGVLQLIKGGLPVGVFVSKSVIGAKLITEGVGQASYGGRPEETYLIEKDGNSWCAHNALFKSLPESHAAFGDTPPEAVKKLLEEEAEEDTHNNLSSLEESKGCQHCKKSAPGTNCSHFDKRTSFCSEYEDNWEGAGNAR